MAGVARAGRDAFLQDRAALERYVPSKTPTATALPPVRMKKATALIAVDAIEPCLPFWTDRLGFEEGVTVPHEGAIGFAMLTSGGVELMYQSRASIEADLVESGAPAGLGAELAASTTTLFVEVDALDDVIEMLGAEADVVVPRRRTFYGMDEIFVRAPCGTLVGFAAKVE